MYVMYVWIDMYVCMYGNILFTYIYVCIGVCWDDVCSSSFCQVIHVNV